MDGQTIHREWWYRNLPLSVNFEDREADTRITLRWMLINGV
jgi:hypothetical protein